MKAVKARLTVSVDPQLVDAGQEAVTAGRADSLSAWVSVALAERVAKERRLRALARALAHYEAQFGVITEEELTEQARADRQNARVVRGSRQGRKNRPRRSA